MCVSVLAGMDELRPPDDVLSLLRALQDRVPRAKVQEWVVALDTAVDDLLTVVKMVREGHLIRSPSAAQAALDCILADDLRLRLARLEGVTAADEEAYPDSVEVAKQDTAMLIAYLTALLAVLTRNNVTRYACLMPQGETRETAVRLVELYGRWVDPVHETLLSSCRGGELPLATSAAVQNPHSRARQHFELAKRSPEHSATFLRSLTDQQRLLISQALLPQERIAFDAALKAVRSKQPTPDASKHNGQHARLMVHPTFDRPLLSAASATQIRTLADASHWGPLLMSAKAQVDDAVKRDTVVKDNGTGEVLWGHLLEQGGNDVVRALQVDALTPLQFVHLLSASTEARIERLNRWLGFNNGTPIGEPRPEVDRLIRHASELLKDDAELSRLLTSNAAGSAFLTTATAQITNEAEQIRQTNGFRQVSVALESDPFAYEDYEDGDNAVLQTAHDPQHAHLIQVVVDGGSLREAVVAWIHGNDAQGGQDVAIPASILDVLRNNLLPLFK